MNTLRSLIIFICCLSSLQALAQTASIRGSVSDASSGTGLYGATVRLADSPIGTAANAYGEFRLQDLEPGTYELEVSFIGFEKVIRTVTLKEGATPYIKVILTESEIDLEQVEVNATPGTGTPSVTALDLLIRPVTSSQDILQVVPGLFIAQHAGGGKAEQIFLRGFDIDHGTDIALTVDGMPVNMVSHAHGQGYADLHFVIPETIERVSFDKGPYYANKGNLNTAGFVDYQLRKRLTENKVLLEGGSFGTYRGLAMLRLLPEKAGKPGLYLATEYTKSAGYFESPQDFSRFNGLLKFHQKLAAGGSLEASASAFTSSWDASGQIPERAVAQGSISRFGAIDDTEGGQTSRYNLNVKHSHNLGNGRWLTSQVWGSAYEFDLLSNFTFFLNDPVNGDQIRQIESRTLWGTNHNYFQENQFLGFNASTEIGLGFRTDRVNDVRLSRTFQKETVLSDLARGDVRETNLFAFAEEIIDLNPSLSLTTGLRYDYFRFGYTDKLSNTGSTLGQGLLSPKVQLDYAALPQLNLFIKAGSGFHSNDSRVATQAGRAALPKALGIDLGANWKANENLLISVALWQLHLDQEFVYVGDEGIVEASGNSRRKGIDLGMRYELVPGLIADMDMNFTEPRFTDNREGNQRVPLAPTFTSVGGLKYETKQGFSTGLRYRWLGNRAANEDGSLQAEGYFLLDAVVRYQTGRFEWGLQAENLLNVDWNEAQFETESRLRNESVPVSEIHFTPGTPFGVRLSMVVNF